MNGVNKLLWYAMCQKKKPSPFHSLGRSHGNARAKMP